MKHLVKPPKISITRLILTVGITAGIIVFAIAQLTKETKPGEHRSVPDRYSRRSDTATAEEVIIHTNYSENVKSSYLELDSLTAKQVIEAVSKYHHIPVVYRSKRLAKQDKSFSGGISLEDKIENITATLNYLGIYVSYDGKQIIAGE